MHGDKCDDRAPSSVMHEQYLERKVYPDKPSSAIRIQWSLRERDRRLLRMIRDCKPCMSTSYRLETRQMENKPDECRAPSLLDPQPAEGWLVKREPSLHSRAFVRVQILPYTVRSPSLRMRSVSFFKSKDLHQTILRVSQSSTPRLGNRGRTS
jgi:hypothetical protein